MVIIAERERLKQAKAEKEAEKQRIRASKEAEKEQKRKEREALEAEREVKRKEKEAKKQQEEAEKEQKRKEKEAADAEKEQKRKERELKKQQEEAEKEQKRKERELKRQQDEAEKEQKKKEKEAAERKKQLLLQKQATIMDRLFSRQGKQSSAGTGSSPPQALESESISRQEPSTVVSRVDEELRSTCIKSEAELLRSHVVSWQEKWKCRSSEPFRRWGMRLTPKVTMLPELRLQGTSMARCSNSEAQAPSLKRKRDEDDNLDECKLEDDIVMLDNDDVDVISSPPKKKQCNSRWKLLQFDKSYRPAYYGTFSKVSSNVRPRHPLRKEPSLDYEVDSDEEWEEEDPGESLSDCEDKEDELEKVEVESDEDAAEGFVVPDGYLSEDEGVHVGGKDLEDGENSKEPLLLGESSAGDGSLGSMDQMVRRQHQLLKVLDDVTQHALKRNRPFLVSNFSQELGEKGTDAENRTERLCFEALRMCVVAPDIVIGPPPFDSPSAEQGGLSLETAEEAGKQKIRTVKKKRKTVEVAQ